FVLFGLALGTVLPHLGVPVGWAVALGVACSVPLWTGLMLWTLLAPSGRGAWLRIGATCVVLGGATAAGYFV
ncbi:MAG: hypothetical protein AAGA56_21845, partial [Myxococcota bacterium]